MKIDISQLTSKERLETMEALWDALVNEDAELESPSWHVDVLKSRKKAIEEGSAEFISLEELKHR